MNDLLIPRVLATLVMICSVTFLFGCKDEKLDQPSGGPLAAATDEDNDGRPSIPALDSTGLEVAPFRLIKQDGEPMDSAELAGAVYVAHFFFTACPVECPKMIQAVERLEHQFGHLGVRFLSITVDPDNDTPERLTRYAREHKIDLRHWSLLTGTIAEIESVAHTVFRLPLEKLMHSEKLVLVDRQSQIAGFYNGLDAESTDQLAERARELLLVPDPGEAVPPPDTTADDSDLPPPPASAFEDSDLPPPPVAESEDAAP